MPCVQQLRGLFGQLQDNVEQFAQVGQHLIPQRRQQVQHKVEEAGRGQRGSDALQCITTTPHKDYNDVTQLQSMYTYSAIMLTTLSQYNDC